MAFAIIAAGGKGERLSSGTAKFETPLLGRPMVGYSLDAFQGAVSIERLVLVVPPDRVSCWLPGNVSCAKLSATVAGGSTRQQSVLNGLEALECGEGVVVIHDAARPMVTAKTIEAACRIPDDARGVITAVPVADTIKRVEEDLVVETLARSGLVAVQTPQAFDLSALLSAHREAARQGFEGTDDASLIEWMGGSVRVIEGAAENFKVTYPPDVLLAEAILRGRDS
jgi:2-C-methyl-D-erythritol 4-phosphate cytidylyltransferase